MASEEEFARQDEELVDLRFSLRRADSELEVLRRERNLLRKELVMREAELERAREFLDRAHLLARAEVAEAIADERLGRLQGLESALSKLRRKPSGASTTASASASPSTLAASSASPKATFTPAIADAPAPPRAAMTEPPASPRRATTEPAVAAMSEAATDASMPRATTDTSSPRPAVAQPAVAVPPVAAEQTPAPPDAAPPTPAPTAPAEPAGSPGLTPTPGFILDAPVERPLLRAPALDDDDDRLGDLADLPMADLPPGAQGSDRSGVNEGSNRLRRFRDDLRQSRRALP